MIVWTYLLAQALSSQSTFRMSMLTDSPIMWKASRLVSVSHTPEFCKCTSMSLNKNWLSSLKDQAIVTYWSFWRTIPKCSILLGSEYHRSWDPFRQSICTLVVKSNSELSTLMISRRTTQPTGNRQNPQFCRLSRAVVQLEWVRDMQMSCYQTISTLLRSSTLEGSCLDKLSIKMLWF